MARRCPHQSHARREHALDLRREPWPVDQALTKNIVSEIEKNPYAGIVREPDNYFPRNSNGYVSLALYDRLHGTRYDDTEDQDRLASCYALLLAEEMGDQDTFDRLMNTLEQEGKPKFVNSQLIYENKTNPFLAEPCCGRRCTSARAR